MYNRTYGIERLGALTDGVCATGMTLLILDLRIAIQPGGDEEKEIVQSLLDQSSAFAAWIISFLLIARIWQELHATASELERSDAGLIALTICALATCSLVPFGSALVGHYHDSPISAIVFSGILLLNGYLLAAITRYVSRRPELRRKEAMEERFRFRSRYFFFAFSIVGAVAIGFAFQDPVIGIAAWAVEPLVALILTLRRAG